MKKTHKVLLLNTEGISNIGIPLDDLQYDKDGFDPHIIQNKHLHILSDDEIKEGDWFTTSVYSSKYNHNTLVHKCSSRPKDKDEEFNWVNTGDFTFNPITCKKIVATTDKSIGIRMFDENGARTVDFNLELPQLPESFIQAYIKAYNEGKPITEVDLEVDCDHSKMPEKVIDVIKTRPDNTVIIHQSKMYSREEMIKLIQDKIDEYGGDAQGDIEYIALFCFQDWIEDNL